MQAEVIETTGKPEKQTRFSETSIPGVSVSFYEADTSPGRVPHKDDWQNEIHMKNPDGSQYIVEYDGESASVVLRSETGAIIRQGSSRYIESAGGTPEAQEAEFVGLAQEFAAAFDKRKQNPDELAAARETAKV